MRKVIWICDRCGQQIDGTVTQVTFRNSISGDEDGEILETNYGPELCPDCLNELKEFLTSNSTPAPQPKPRRASKRAELDLGKMAALRNAGWSYAKIADELHVSAQTVANRMPEAIEFLNNQEANDE